jgi:hypothetical protein
MHGLKIKVWAAAGLHETSIPGVGHAAGLRGVLQFYAVVVFQEGVSLVTHFCPQ